MSRSGLTVGVCSVAVCSQKGGGGSLSKACPLPDERVQPLPTMDSLEQQCVPACRLPSACLPSEHGY